MHFLVGNGYKLGRFVRLSRLACCQLSTVTKMNVQLQDEWQCDYASGVQLTRILYMSMRRLLKRNYYEKCDSRVLILLLSNDLLLILTENCAVALNRKIAKQKFNDKQLALEWSGSGVVVGLHTW
jgi:hypothetical protein